MARRIDYSARYHFGADEVYAALSSRSYWEDVVEEMNKYSPNYIDSFHVDRSGVDITFHHVIPRDMLPDLARAILRKDMVITRKQSFSPWGKVVTGKYEASVPAAPGNLTGTMRLYPTETGCVLDTTSIAKVYLPGIGSKLEQLILVNLIDLFRGEAEITVRWLDKLHAA